MVHGERGRGRGEGGARFIIALKQFAKREIRLALIVISHEVWDSLKGKSSQKTSGPKYVSCGFKNRFLCL